MKWGVSGPRVNWTKSCFGLISSFTTITPSSPVLRWQHASGSRPWCWRGAYAGVAVAGVAAGLWGFSPPWLKSLLASVWASWWGESRRLWGSGRTWPGRCGMRGNNPPRWLSPGTLRDSAAAKSRHRQLKESRSWQWAETWSNTQDMIKTS